ncbi:MAG: nuclear transport factor 2 family protein [Pseudohaliea sp.]
MAATLDTDRLFAAIDARDARAFAAFLTDDAEFQFGNAPPVTGREAIEAYVGTFFEALGGVSHHVEALWDSEDRLTCHGEVRYERRDGSTLTVPFANVLYLAEGRVSRYLVFIDNSALFA